MIKQLPARQRIRKALVLLVFLFPHHNELPLPVCDPLRCDERYGQHLPGDVRPDVYLLPFPGPFVVRVDLPGFGMGEIAEPINRKPVNVRRIGWIKWVVWSIWIAMVTWIAISAGGYKKVNLLLLTETGIAVDAPEKYFIYYLVLGLFFGLAFFVGKRAGCLYRLPHLHPRLPDELGCERHGEAQ